MFVTPGLLVLFSRNKLDKSVPHWQQMHHHKSPFQHKAWVYLTLTFAAFVLMTRIFWWPVRERIYFSGNALSSKLVYIGIPLKQTKAIFGINITWLRNPTGWWLTSWLFLNAWLPRTNPASTSMVEGLKPGPPQGQWHQGCDDLSWEISPVFVVWTGL